MTSRILILKIILQTQTRYMRSLLQVLAKEEMKSGKCLRLNLDKTQSLSQDFQELQINHEPEIWFFRQERGKHVDVVCRQLKHPHVCVWLKHIIGLSLWMMA